MNLLMEAGEWAQNEITGNDNVYCAADKSFACQQHNAGIISGIHLYLHMSGGILHCVSSGIGPPIGI